MKQARLFFTVVLVPIDYAMLLAAAITTYVLRLGLSTVRPVITPIPSQPYLNAVVIVAAAWIILFALNGLYTIGRRRLLNEITRVIFGCATGFVAVLIYLVFKQEAFSSRFILLGTFLLAIVYVALGRLVIRGLERFTLAQGIGVINVALIGSSETRLIFQNEFKSKPGLGYRICSEYDQLTEKTNSELQSLHSQGKLDGIILTDPNISRIEALKVINLTEDLHIRFFYSADLFTTTTTNISIHTLAGVPVIEPKRTRLDGWGRIIKRFFDILISLILLILISPILLIIAIIVAIETGRPILFQNERVGEHERTFDTLKFRSMYQKDCIGKQFPDHEHALKQEATLIQEQSTKKGPVYKIKNDPRVTPFGAFIRRWSLDELPQLWNVFRGDMSLVGPRPHQPREVEKYARHHRHVLAIKPGITGLAQISGRSDLDFEEEIRLDTYYIENWSIGLDLIIILKTPFVVLLRRGAY